MDLFPVAGGALVGTGDGAHVAADDFNGTDRMGVADIGAYAFAEGGNPGWVIAEGFKDEVGGTMPGTDGGTTMPDGGSRPDGGTPPDGGGGDGGGTPDASGGSGDDGGCGCRTAAPRSQASLLAMLVVTWLVTRRRRI
jgi:MYXO-CTERM domain-containing protein